MGALTRLILALFLGACAAMIYFGEQAPVRGEVSTTQPSRASSILVTTLAPVDDLPPLTLLFAARDGTHLRAGPSHDAAIVERLPLGSPLVVIKDLGAGWLRVHATEQSAQGFLPMDQVSRDIPG